MSEEADQRPPLSLAANGLRLPDTLLGVIPDSEFDTETFQTLPSALFILFLDLQVSVTLQER